MVKVEKETKRQWFHGQWSRSNFSRTSAREVGQGLIAGRKQLGPVKVVKPSLRGVTGSVTCKSQRQRRERVPVAALGKAAEGVMDITGV